MDIQRALGIALFDQKWWEFDEGEDVLVAVKIYGSQHPRGGSDWARWKAGIAYPRTARRYRFSKPIERENQNTWEWRFDPDEREPDGTRGLIASMRECAADARRAAMDPTPENKKLTAKKRVYKPKNKNLYDSDPEDARDAEKRRARDAEIAAAAEEIVGTETAENAEGTKKKKEPLKAREGYHLEKDAYGGFIEVKTKIRHKNPQRVKPKREKGVRNAIPRILKELIFEAMDMVGRDGKGKDMAAGYLARVAIRYPEIFGRFVEKLIPYSVTGAEGGPVRIAYDDKQAILHRMRERGMPIPKSLMGTDGAPRGQPVMTRTVFQEAVFSQSPITDPATVFSQPSLIDSTAVSPEEMQTIQDIVEAPIRENIEERGGDPNDEILPLWDDDGDNADEDEGE